MNDRKSILESLEPLFQQAVREKKWFYCTYQAMIFSPKELRERHKNGELVWGPVNWQLLDPPSLKNVNAEAARIQKENDSLSLRISEGFSI